MRVRAFVVFVLVCAATGCSQTHVQSDTALGRVIVYRNGVAYFERSAVLEGDRLEMSVPDAQLDDFLKSLSVQDEATGAVAPVSYQANAGGTVDLRVRLPGPSPHRVRLSYVTEAPAWKPTYRVTLGSGNTIALQAWAIVDNTSGEDWNGVRLGVSSGSALSFRYDLRSVRNVARDRLEPQGLAALAPPTGGAPYGAAPASGLVASLDERALGLLEGEEQAASDPSGVLAKIVQAEARLDVALRQARQARDVVRTLCLNDKATQVTAVRKAFQQQASGISQAVATALLRRADQLSAEANQCVGEEAGFVGQQVTVDIQPRGNEERPTPPTAPKGPMGGSTGPSAGPPPAAAPSPNPTPADGLHELERKVSSLKEKILRDKLRVRLLSDTIQAGSLEDANRRGELLKARLVRAGIPAERVTVEARRAEQHGLSVVTEPFAGPEAPKPKPDLGALQPIPSSIFEAKDRLDVPRSSSVMLSLHTGPAEGEAVYYYDAEGPRGNASFPFRALRLKNPTRATLESGPVTVVSEGRFLGEGVADPIPAGSWAFVPFALDRQVVADRDASESDAIARIVTARRGIFTTAVERTKKTRIELFNRSPAAVVVYVRHVPLPGHALRRAPSAGERLNGAHLFRVVVPAKGKHELEIVEVATVERATDIRTAEGAKLLRAYVEAESTPAEIRARVLELTRLSDELGVIGEKLGTKRAQQKELRERLHELHAEVVTLKTVKSSGRLLQDLEKKLQETSDRVSKGTSEIVELEEKQMVAKIRLQDAVAELRFERDPAKDPVARSP